MSLPGWGTLAGVIAKAIDPLISPTQRNSRAIEHWNHERRKLLATKPVPKDLVNRLHECDRNIFRLSAEKERLNRG